MLPPRSHPGRRPCHAGALGARCSMKGGERAYTRGPSLGWLFAKCCCCFPCRGEWHFNQAGGTEREWGEGSGEAGCCERPWAQFPRQEIALALDDAELQLRDAGSSLGTRLLPSEFGLGGCSVRRGTWCKKHNSVLIYIWISAWRLTGSWLEECL